MEINFKKRRENMESIFEKCGFKLIPLENAERSPKNKTDGYKDNNGELFYFYWNQCKDGLNLVIDPNFQYEKLLKIDGINLQNTRQENGIRYGTQMQKLPSTYGEHVPDKNSFIGRMFKISESSIPDFLKILSEKNSEKKLQSLKNNKEMKENYGNVNQPSKTELTESNHQLLHLDLPSPPDITGRYQDDPKKRKCTELYSVKKAWEHYSRLGFSIIEKGKPFDLLCTRGALVVHVEVKGTTGNGDVVILTKNEVKDARDEAWRSDLFIVKNIVLTVDGDSWTASGGVNVLHEAWIIEEKDLEPSEFLYKVPMKP